MDPRDRIMGPIAQLRDDSREAVDVEFGDLVRKLILSEEVILESIRLLELPALIRKFGFDGVKALLESKRLRIHCDALTIGQTGQADGALMSRARKGALPLGSYCFQIVGIADRREYIHRNLQPINDVPGLKAKQAQRLRKLTAEAIVTPPEDAGVATLAQLEADLTGNVPLLRQSVALATEQHLGHTISPDAFELEVERIDNTDWQTKTNLGERLGLSPESTHRAVEHGLLGVGGLGQRLEYMMSRPGSTETFLFGIPALDEMGR